MDDLLQLQSHSHPPVCIFLQFNAIICSISALSLNALCFLLASDYTNLTCFQTASHPGRKMFGFIFHLKYIILMFSFQINIYLQDMWVFSLILFSVSRELWTQSYWKWQCKTKTTRTMSPVALQRYQIIPSSLLFFLPFVYHCFLFCHNMWDVQTLKAAPRSFVWGTHHYPTPQPCMEWMLKNVRTMCIMYNNVLNIRSPLLHWDFCLYSPGLSGLIDLSWILH